MTYDLDELREVFRGHILAALDAAAVEAFALARQHGAGASDADLPRLFKALDEQIRTLVARYGVTLTEGGKR